MEKTRQSYLEECKAKFIGLTLDEAFEEAGESYDWIVTEVPLKTTARVPVLVRLEKNVIVDVEIPERII